MKAPDLTGAAVRDIAVKVLYTFDDEHSVNCLARTPKLLPVQVFHVDAFNAQIGIVDLQICAIAVAAASPELTAKLGQDYALYVKDTTELGEPFVGHGMLSWVLSSSSRKKIKIAGRVTNSLLSVFAGGCRETLEVKMRLARVESATQKDFVQSMKTFEAISKFFPADMRPATWLAMLKTNPQMLEMAPHLTHATESSPNPSQAEVTKPKDAEKGKRRQPRSQAGRARPTAPRKSHKKNTEQADPQAQDLQPLEPAPPVKAAKKIPEPPLQANNIANSEARASSADTSPPSEDSPDAPTLPSSPPPIDENERLQETPRSAASSPRLPAPYDPATQHADQGDDIPSLVLPPRSAAAQSEGPAPQSEGHSEEHCDDKSGCKENSCKDDPASDAGDETSKAAAKASGKPMKAVIERRLEKSITKGLIPDFCENCGNINTVTWRKYKVRNGEQEAQLRLCNRKCRLVLPTNFAACGIYFRQYRRLRPENLWSKDEPVRRPNNGPLKAKRPFEEPKQVPSSNANANANANAKKRKRGSVDERLRIGPTVTQSSPIRKPPPLVSDIGENETLSDTAAKAKSTMNNAQPLSKHGPGPGPTPALPAGPGQGPAGGSDAGHAPGKENIPPSCNSDKTSSSIATDPRQSNGELPRQGKQGKPEALKSTPTKKKETTFIEDLLKTPSRLSTTIRNACSPSPWRSGIFASGKQISPSRQSAQGDVSASLMSPQTRALSHILDMNLRNGQEPSSTVPSTDPMLASSPPLFQGFGSDARQHDWSELATSPMPDIQTSKAESVIFDFEAFMSEDIF